MPDPNTSGRSTAQVEFRRDPAGTLRAVLSGAWRAAQGVPDSEKVQGELQKASPASLSFDTAGVTAWDSGLISFLLQCRHHCEAAGVTWDEASLPSGIRHLLDLALAVPKREDARRGTARESFVTQVGVDMLQLADACRINIEFLGDCVLALGRVARCKATFLRSDAWTLMQRCGADALPIVALIGFLIGAIIAFVGAVQLARFGASIYVADMVGVAMAREMGVMMTGIIMCGRTGAAFAAELGTMKVNQELDAFRTFGIAPVDFLAAPRILALFLMMPLLTLFSDFVGIGGGFLVSMGMLNMSAAEYWSETISSLSLTHLMVGLVKSLVFGLLIGITACECGLQCGSDAAAVGRATTTAVVRGITLLIVADAVFAVLTSVLHF